MKNSEKPILSISLLASNRMDTIPRCLDSLTPIREALPCELIIVDTSNSPEVHECILKYTDIVEKFEWCNDFSKARNVGVDRAKGEWFMFLDDDEWFLDSEPLIQFFLSGEYKEYGFAHYRIYNYGDEAFKTYSSAWVKRLMKLEENTRFHSKVHEYLAPNVGKNKALEAIVGHSGYIYKTEDDRKKHFERNTSLLKLMEEEEPDELRWKIQHIQEYRSIGAWEELENYCKKTIKYLHSKERRIVIYTLAQIYLAYICALVNLGKYQEAKDFYKTCARMFEEKTFVLRAWANAYMTEAGHRLGDYDYVCEQAGAYVESYKLYHNDPKVYAHEELGLVFMDAFTEKTYRIMNSFLLFAKLEIKDYTDIPEVFSNLLWETKNKKLLYDINIKLVDVLVELDDYDMLKVVLQKTMSFSELKTLMFKKLAILKYEDENAFKKVVDIVKEINIWEWYNMYVEFLTSSCFSVDVTRVLGAELVKGAPNVFQIPVLVLDAFTKYGIEIEELYKELDFATWKNQVVEHFECAKMSQLDKLKERLENSCLKDDVRFGYFMMLYSEQKLVQSIDAGLHMDEYSNLLASFATYTCITYEALYGAGIRELPVEELPDNYHAALWIQKFFEEAGKDLRGALPCLGRVAEVYPFLQESVKYYLYLIKTEVFQG